jgi:hypothetical protein
VQHGEQTVGRFEGFVIKRDLMRIDTLIRACGHDTPDRNSTIFDDTLRLSA